MENGDLMVFQLALIDFLPLIVQNINNTPEFALWYFFAVTVKPNRVHSNPVPAGPRAIPPWEECAKR